MKNIYFLSLLLLCSYGLSAQVFFTESFEAAGNYTAGSAGDCSCVSATTDAIDGSNDHFADVVDADIAHNFSDDYTGELDASGNPGEGTARYWASEDNDDPQVGGSGNPIQCVTMSVNITGRMNLGFVGLFGGHGASSPSPYEGDNDMEVSFDIDGGGFTKVLDWHESLDQTNISLDTDNDQVGDGTFALNGTFQQVAVPIAGTGNTLTVQICTHSDSSTEEFAFDYIRVREIALPVDLTKFSAYNSVGTRDVSLEWETASETNNSHFNIQRSMDGINFDNVHRTIGHGTSSINHKYLHVDKNIPAADRLYYRLEQVDFDGTATLSDIEVIEFNKSGTIKNVQLFPNPAKDQTMLDLGEAIREETQISLFNNNGQLIKQFMLPEGSVNYNLQIGDLPNGNYMLRIDASDGPQTIPFTKISKE